MRQKQSLFDDVRDFNFKFGLPHDRDGREPQMLEPSVEDFRVKFMQEELDEFVLACERHLLGHSGALAEAADALVDLVYVALGTAHMMAVPFDECWAEVQRANMQKVRASGADDPRTKRSHSLDIVKPDGWRPPDIEGVLRRTEG